MEQRKRGRKPGRNFEVNISPRVSRELKEQFECLAQSQGVKTSEFIRRLMEREVRAAQQLKEPA